MLLCIERVSDTENKKAVSDRLKRQTAARFLGVAEEEISFSYNENGKPILQGFDAHLNTSRSGEYIVCCCSERPVGIDMERKREVRPALYRVLTESEAAYVLEGVCGDVTERFFRIWTMKEAAIKCLGGKLSDFRNFTFSWDGDVPVCSDKELEFSFPNAPDGYVMTVCEKRNKGIR